jgi:hypothetical protein
VLLASAGRYVEVLTNGVGMVVTMNVEYFARFERYVTLVRR